MSEPGQSAYEDDVRQCPTYPDGTPRKSWEELDELARWSWSRPNGGCVQALEAK